ncbi:hypothetical protein [Exiguobacterium antarcticum]|uniref:hypothetical protein n=1 Tax=Exiguobacterium antarcticum TaxID=132920 RepID=UPI00047898FD|nr:hypothetical protein [Exiguobacterium antarcticum]
MEAPFKAPGGGKKKLDNKKVMFLAVGGIIVVVLVLMRRPAASNPDAPTAYVAADGYENFGQSNGIGVEQVDARVDTALNAALASLEADNNASMNGYFQTTNDYIKDRDEAYAKQLKKLAADNKKLNTELDQQEKIDKAQADALKKLQAKKPIKAQPTTPIKNPIRTTPKKPVKAQPTTSFKNVKINYSGNSIVDALKKAGIGSTMTNRAEIAAGNGIKGYRGTASQNTALLKKAKAGKLRITPSMRK